MEPMRLREIAEACEGTLCGDGVQVINGVSTDSRSVGPKDLFIAIRGEKFDGHDFISQVASIGVGAVLTSRPVEGIASILVDDTIVAMHRLAKHYREKFRIPYIAVTGSSGKTTTKEMIAAVLEEQYCVLKNEGNYNNAIGLPLTIFRLNKTHEIAVLEMGMNSFGEIKALADIVEPETAIISNVGMAHIERLGSREGILKAKCEVFTHFHEDCTGIVNGDNDMLQTIVNPPFHLVRFGFGENCEVRGVNIVSENEEGSTFVVELFGQLEQFFVPLAGKHNIYNALSAIAVGARYGVPVDSMKNGLRHFKSAKMRMDIFMTTDDIKVINDVYNANPDAMLATLHVLGNIKKGRRSVAVLGDMLELGDIGAEAHRKVGRCCHDIGVNLLITLGPLAEGIAEGALAAGMSPEMVVSYQTNEALIEDLDLFLRPGDIVLIKGSRAMNMEKIIDVLKR